MSNGTMKNPKQTSIWVAPVIGHSLWEVMGSAKYHSCPQGVYISGKD